MKKKILLMCFATILMSVFTFPILASEFEVNSLPTLEKVELTLSIGEKCVSRTVRLDNGMYLIYTLESTGLRATNRRTLTSECVVRGKDGTELGTLTAKGVFDTNGITSKPEDAYGFGKVKHYLIKNTSNTLSSEQFAAWVRVTMNGLPTTSVLEFTYQCVINCDANGNSSASWN